MVSSEGEVVPFTTPVNIYGNSVESWLGKVEKAMKLTLKDLLGKAIATHAGEYFGEWVMNWPSQVILAANQVVFTYKVSQHLRAEPRKLENFYEKILEKLSHYIQLVRGQISNIERSTINSLLVMEVHNRDIIDQLIEAKVSNINDFQWASHLRYYWEEDRCIVRMANASFQYGYEYLGL